MKTVRFILQKIVIVEVMLIILFLAKNLFEVSIPIIDFIIDTSLMYLTPISVIAFILYIILSIFSLKILEIAIGVILGGIILYYLYTYML